ncbi:MAG: aldo/keto reductase [Burkholderiales bacterium]
MHDRRDFLRLGLGSALGLSLAGSSPEAAAKLQIRRYARLGKTELRISDISFGSASSSDPALVRHAFERGVNYFDTAESYRGGNSEEAIGEALRGKRDQVILATKTKAGAGDTRKDMMQALDQSLKRLRSDYVDIYFNHAVNDVARMQNQEWWEFTALAKKQGKIRFRGMSGHGGQLVQCLDYAIDNKLVDVILVAYNFGHDPKLMDKLRHTFHWAALQPELPRVLAKAKKNDIGIVAMKVLMGAKLNDMRPYETGGATFAQAAFRWTLSTDYPDALIVSMTDKAQIDEYLGASGEYKLRQGDVELLQRYAQLQLGTYCQPACNACETSCPDNVEIAEVLRTRMYAVDYRDPILAKSEYLALATNAAACVTCAHQSCLRACPNGVPIATFTRDAALRLG